MSAMNFKESWEFLDQLQFFKIKLGLESMNRFLTDLGNPQEKLRFVHIGGTNGKGSVGATLLSLLSSAGFRVGFYSSPHLSSVRERFRLGTSFISEADFAVHATEIRDVMAGRQITYFEFTTTLALLWFARQKVDLVLLEVGMGGRLDATNVVTPLVSIITNVSMDHEQYLGNTLAEVAGEKAGIIKPAIPVVSGVAGDDSRKVVEQTCRDRKAPLYLLGRDFYAQPAKRETGWDYTGIEGERGQRQDLLNLPLQIRGSHQIENSGLALAALELLDSHGYFCNEKQIREGLEQVRWPGRMEEFWRDDEGTVWWHKRNDQETNHHNIRHYLLDGAHNPAGVQALKEFLTKGFSSKKIILVWAAMEDKDLKETLTTIAPLARTIIFTRPESERSATPEQLRNSLTPADSYQIICEDSVEDAMSKARKKSTWEDLICVAGSLYLVGKVRQILCGEIVA